MRSLSAFDSLGELNDIIILNIDFLFKCVDESSPRNYTTCWCTILGSG